PFRFAQINGDKAGRRNRWCHHLGNLPFCESAPNLSGSRNLLHGNFYDAGYEFGSDDCADTTKTRRVLTILLPEEY
ncbi:DUF3768 domain-containing protein, partial [Nioella sp.]|uniref:DUF3768 domain-containing protein n=1 Tax=Nioella sp. TaxID=1912091 RepID=UPI0035164BC0